MQNKIKKIFKTKDRYHKSLAKLPFEQKLKILVKLQQLANDIKLSVGLKTKPICKF
jgi:hypothetical protein